MSYVTTFTGKHFDPVEPDDSLIEDLDIAHSLSLLCRGNGHTKIFYSVGQHSIACAKEAEARGETREVILGCLVHDASEAYLSDVTRPVKKDLDYYLKVEDKLQNMLWRHYLGRDITDDERRRIFAVDDDMLDKEFHELMAEDLGDSYKNLVRIFTCEYQNPEDVSKEYIALLDELRNID